VYSDPPSDNESRMSKGLTGLFDGVQWKCPLREYMLAVDTSNGPEGAIVGLVRLTYWRIVVGFCVHVLV
jgi:hypothetical protein